MKIGSMCPEEMKALIDVAQGKEKADLAIIGGDLVNVYTGELLPGYSVAVKGERIAFVGEDAEHTIGTDTKIINATGKTLVPGFIDAHTHVLACYTTDEFLKYAMKGGTTTIISETIELAFSLGAKGVRQSLESIKNQPIKIFVTIPPMITMSPTAQIGSFRPRTVRGLLKQENVVGLGESFWRQVIEGDERILEMFADTLALGKKLEGHSAGATGKKLAAYVASGVSSCHEPTTADEVLERLRLGMWVMAREGVTRKDLEAIAKIKDEKVDLRRLAFGTDGVSPQYLIEHGYMESVVQKAIDLGFDPIVAIQMATINAAEHFSLDGILGGIAPGKYADMVIIPNPRTIQAEVVISNGKVIAEKGQILVPPRKYTYPKSSRRSVRLPRKVEPADFNIRVEGSTPVTVRVIDLITDIVSREAQIAITPSKGLLEADLSRDILKVAVIDRFNQPGKMFVGFVKGFKMRRGAFASTDTWDLSAIVVVGTNDHDMVLAVNRIVELQGGDVVCAEGKILTELPLPIGGKMSDLPLEPLSQKMAEVQQRIVELGATSFDTHLTIAALTSAAIPFLRICESGLMDLRENKVVGLIVH